MKKLGGNPKVDSEGSKDRFKTFIVPILTTLGYVRLKGNSHIMVNDDLAIIIVSKSCTSDTKHANELKALSTSLKKKYKGYSIYLFLHRPKNEWIYNKTYISTLNRIIGNKSFNGIIVGIEEFVNCIKDIELKKFMYKI